MDSTFLSVVNGSLGFRLGSAPSKQKLGLLFFTIVGLRSNPDSLALYATPCSPSCLRVIAARTIMTFLLFLSPVYWLFYIQ